MDLFHRNSICLQSDDQTIGSANILHISKEDYKIVLFFETKDIEKNGCISISTKNSQYAPFHLLFMQLYLQLQNYEEEFHQIHIEEVVYEKQFVKK